MKIDSPLEWEKKTSVERIGGVGDLQSGMPPIGEEPGKISFEAVIGTA